MLLQLAASGGEGNESFLKNHFIGQLNGMQGAPCVAAAVRHHRFGRFSTMPGVISLTKSNCNNAGIPGVRSCFDWADTKFSGTQKPQSEIKS
jgi:hypothetical protein